MSWSATFFGMFREQSGSHAASAARWLVYRVEGRAGVEFIMFITPLFHLFYRLEIKSQENMSTPTGRMIGQTRNTFYTTS